MLPFDNRLLRELPGEAFALNQTRAVHGALWSPVAPTPVAAPRLLSHSPETALLLGLEGDEWRQDWLAALAGNALLPGMQTYATNYGGHQFGSWAGQLGDGRAIFLGETVNAAGQRYEIQLKGAGVTPYSRRGDGRAVLRSSLREFLCSEAMHHLGIPTTRALALVASGETVVRDMFYDGHPQAEPGAIVCRVAPSFLRFGHFELPAARGDDALLQRLIDFAIARDFPHVDAAPEAAGDERLPHWFAEIARRTAEMVVHWMRVGFVHGVMNTDNMSILGLSIDYGPYGWIEEFDPAWTPNTTDAQGRRYCFARQPEIARWNLERLADALSLVAPQPARLQDGLDAYDATYATAFRRSFAAKFGFSAWQEGDETLVEDAFALLQRGALDMSLFFRQLGELTSETISHQTAHQTLAEASYRPDAWQAQTAAWDNWHLRWHQRLRADGRPDALRQTAMHAVNPRFIPRNYLAQQAIDAAEGGDLAPLHDLLDTLRRPYDEQPQRAAHAAKRPDWARHKAGCSMLSCSS